MGSHGTLCMSTFSGPRILLSVMNVTRGAVLPLFQDKRELKQEVIDFPSGTEPEVLSSTVLPLCAFITRNAAGYLIEFATTECEPLVHFRAMAFGSVPSRWPRHLSVLERIQVQAGDAVGAA